MRKEQWAGIEKSQKALKRNVKILQQAGEFLKEFPEEGYMRDNISKNLVVIKDCKSSSLRRYSKLLSSFYYLVTSAKEKELLINKKKEIDAELDMRDDGIISQE